MLTYFGRVICGIEVTVEFGLRTEGFQEKKRLVVIKSEKISGGMDGCQEDLQEYHEENGQEGRMIVGGVYQSAEMDRAGVD
jgi:hypothetical protein